MNRQADFCRFKELMAWASSRTVMPGDKRVAELTDVLFEDLERYPYELVDAEIRDYCHHEHFFPMPGDIIGRIDGALAARAWDVTAHAISKCKRWYGVRFPNPVFHYAIRLIGGMDGWKMLCFASYEEIRWLAKEFREHYVKGISRASWEYEPGYFPGISPVTPVLDVASGGLILADELKSLPSGLQVPRPTAIGAA